jgi:hypothetical protein
MPFLSAALLASAALSQIVISDGGSSLPDPAKVFVAGITYGGTGCPSGTVSTALSSDRTTFTMIFDKFVASSGPGVPVTEQRKNCQVNVDLRYPNGWSYSIVSVDYRGYAQLPAGVSATQKANYYFAGQTQQVSSESVFNGPYDNDYLSSDKIPISAYIWSPCGAISRGNVNAQVRLSGNAAALSRGAQVTVDSIDGKVKQIYGLQWRRC